MSEWTFRSDTIYAHEVGKPLNDAARLINDYDPGREMVIRYLQEDGSVHTMRQFRDPRLAQWSGSGAPGVAVDLLHIRCTVHQSTDRHLRPETTGNLSHRPRHESNP